MPALCVIKAEKETTATLKRREESNRLLGVDTVPFKVFRKVEMHN